MRWALLAPLALAACGNAAKIDSARPGTTVKLSGNQGILTLKGKSWAPAITVDASNATFSGIVLSGVTGVHFKGGTVIGTGGKGYGIHVQRSRDVAIDGMTLTGAYRGVVIDRSQDIAVRNSIFTGLISDGVDIAGSQRVLIDRNSCSKFNPKMPTIAADGRTNPYDHADCIQGWSRPDSPPTSDVTVTNNRADGMMQGVFFRSSGARGGGGFDRIVIRDNDLRTGFGNGLYVEGARGAVVRGNRISSVPGAIQVKSGRQVKGNLVFRDSTGETCGNEVIDVPRHEANQPCR